MKSGIYFILALLLFSCTKKDPEILITAGATGGNSIHHINSDSASIQNLYVDVNKDNISEFHFYYYFDHFDPVLYNEGYALSTIDQNEEVYTCIDKNGYPAVLHFGDRINNLLSWSNKRNLILYESGLAGRPDSSFFYQVGNWRNIPYGYLGFKIIKGNKTSYGWMRLDVDSYRNRFYLKDYAYTGY